MICILVEELKEKEIIEIKAENEFYKFKIKNKIKIFLQIIKN